MSTWFSERVLDILGWVNDAYYTRKYGTIARRLGRPGVSTDQARGFIILQIDGLAHDHLLKALAGGQMPYLARRLAEQKLTVSPWRCGLPSTTPAVQAGLMFGCRFDIPGFRWFEKDRGATIVLKRPDQAQEVRARISRGRRGILQGGSCYVSMFDGDADLALFTLSALSSQHFFESLRGLGFLLLFLLSPFRVLRLLWITVMGYLAGLGRRLMAFARPSVINPFDVLSPLLHSVSDVLFTEVQTFGVMLDIYRRVPAIYTNYSSYDEVAHKLGPAHPSALRVLRGLDKRIRQIDRMRQRYRQDSCDLYVISDHGNSPSVPFSWHHGMDLAKFIAAQVGTGSTAGEPDDDRSHSREKLRFLLAELQALEQSLAPPLRRGIAATRQTLDRRAMVAQEGDLDIARQRDVVVSASGPLAHVYFNVSSQPLDLIQVMLLYPGLVDHLLESRGIGAVVGRAGERTVVLGNQGGTLIIDTTGDVLEGEDVVAPYGESGYVASQIHEVAHYPHTGDLMLLGAVEPHGRIVAFEEQVSTHGGLGGPQGLPFVAWPPKHPLSPATWRDSLALYAHFSRTYQYGQDTDGRPAVSSAP